MAEPEWSLRLTDGRFDGMRFTVPASLAAADIIKGLVVRPYLVYEREDSTRIMRARENIQGTR